MDMIYIAGEAVRDERCRGRARQQAAQDNSQSDSHANLLHRTPPYCCCGSLTITIAR